MIFTAYMRLFMGNNMFQIQDIHFERQIDPWFNNAQDKRRTYILALENVVLVANGSINFSMQTPIADNGIGD